MGNIKDKIINRIPCLLPTNDGKILKLNRLQKEALAKRLELFFELELNLVKERAKHEALLEIPQISLN